MRTSKIISVVIGLAVIGGALAGCSSTSATPTPTPTKTSNPHGNPIAGHIPNVVGETADAASAQLKRLGLVPVYLDTNGQRPKTVTGLNVVSTNPAATSIYVKGEKISIVVPAATK